MLGQKQAVLNEVLVAIPGFAFNINNAIHMLSATQLETIKENIVDGILDGSIEYGKDRTNNSEVKAYGRSMVMNHMKKARELNGGCNAVRTTSANILKANVAVKMNKNKGIDMSVLPEDLKNIIRNLV